MALPVMIHLLFLAIVSLNVVSSVSISPTSTYGSVVQSTSIHTWAEDLSPLQVKLVVTDPVFVGTASINVQFSVGGTLSVSCSIEFSGSPCEEAVGCIKPSGYTIGCDGTSSGPLTITLEIPMLDSTKHGSKVEFTQTVAAITDWVNQEFTINLKQCESSLPGATATGTLPTPCGHNCNANFGCNAGFTGSDFAGVCNAVAEWTASNSCVELCNITDNCKNCVIGGGTAPIQVDETKTATCKADFSSPDDPQSRTCASGGAALVFDLQCNASCSARSTCKNCNIAGGLVLPTTINSTESVTAQCIALSSSPDDPQTKTCYDGNEIVMDLNCVCIPCSRLDDGKMAAIVLGVIYLVLVAVIFIMSLCLEPEALDQPIAVVKATSESALVFKYEQGSEVKHHPNIGARKSPNGNSAAVTAGTKIDIDCNGKLSWQTNGEDSQQYVVLAIRGRVVVDEKIVRGASYMHWMASASKYTYVVVAIGKNGEIGEPAKHDKDGTNYHENFSAGMLLLLSLLLIIIGVVLLAVFPNSDCCQHGCDPCGFSEAGIVGLVLAILADLILVALLIWISVESCCSSGSCCTTCACHCCCCYCCTPIDTEGGSGNSLYMNIGAGHEPEATRMMTGNV